MTSRPSSFSATRTSLIELLESRRPMWDRYDKQRIIEHRSAEKEALETFRARLKEAAKWDYKTAAKHSFRTGLNSSGPTCPIPLVPELDRIIAMLKIDSRKAISLEPNGRESRLYWFATHDPFEVSVC